MIIRVHTRFLYRNIGVTVDSVEELSGDTGVDITGSSYSFVSAYQ
jgi:hypothetical protein